MRLILGKGLGPRLLVSTRCSELLDKFEFWVINGNWRGWYDNSTISFTTRYRSEEIDTISNVEILCTDQKLLDGPEECYDEIIARFEKQTAGENNEKIWC